VGQDVEEGTWEKRGWELYWWWERGWKAGFPRRQEPGPLQKHLAIFFSICHRKKTGLLKSKAQKKHQM